jgi:hypothetical protein
MRLYGRQALKNDQYGSRLANPKVTDVMSIASLTCLSDCVLTHPGEAA